MEIKESDLLILAMLRQEVVFLGITQDVNPAINDFIWSKNFERLDHSTRNYAGYKQWKNFVKRIGKVMILRALLEFVPMVKFYNTFYYEVEAPLALKLSRRRLRNIWNESEIEKIIFHLTNWSIDENTASKEFLKSIEILNSTHNCTILESFIINLIGLVAGPKKFTYYYFNAMRTADAPFSGQGTVEYCIKYKIASDILKKYT